MLIQMKEIKTKTYPLDQGFFVDITTTCKTYQAWLYHKEYSFKYLMFEVPKKQQDYDIFLDIVEANVQEYIDQYLTN